MWLYKFSTVLLRRIAPVYWRFRVVGDLDAIPAEGPLIVIANHASFLDPWFIAAVFPRPISYLVTDKWYHGSAFWRSFFRANGTLPVRGHPRRTIEDVVAHLSRGSVIGIFPEGRVSADGTIGCFKTGFARAAAASGAPVVPIGLRGNYEILPRHSRFPKSGTVEVHLGRLAVFADGPRLHVSQHEVFRFRDRIFSDVCRLAGQPAPAREADRSPNRGRTSLRPGLQE